MEWAYKPAIIKRDGPCVLLGNAKYAPCYGPTDIHHIKTIASGGTDEYHNLIALCRTHHATLAHWTDWCQRRIKLTQYTISFTRPDGWDQIMIRSTEQRKQQREAQRARDKKYRQQRKAKVSDIIVQLKEKQRKPQPTQVQLDYKEKMKQKAKVYRHEQYQRQKERKKNHLKKEK